MNEVGDRREAARRWDAAENQPISERERALVARAYALFDCFLRSAAGGPRADAQGAHAAGATNPTSRARTAPTGNTLGSCVDNMIADQIDNLPEAVMLPEREETAQQRGGDGGRGELRALPRGLAGQVSDADGGRHRDGNGRGAGILGRECWRTARAWFPCWRGIRRISTPTRCTRIFRTGGAASR